MYKFVNELNLKDCKRIAIMGGTFDPIHYGHLVTAEAVRIEYDIDLVIFVPTGHPAYKQSEDISNGEQRYLMSVFATMNNPFFNVSRIEIDRPTTTYTIDTIREIREICDKEAKIYFITGADAVQQILSWKDAETLLTLCSFIAVTRPGYNKEKLHEHVVNLKNKFSSKIHFLEVPALAISSTDIRNRVCEGKSIKYLLPPEVEMYIFKSGLYQKKLEGFSFLDIKNEVKKQLSKERFRHTMGVVKESEKLATKYNADIESAKIAAILHDYAKEFSDEDMKKYCKEKNIKLDEQMKKRPMLAHSLVAADLAKNKFGVIDEDVLNAITYHTTARKNMSLLEKIVFVADKIEPCRESYPGLQEIRDAAYEDINKAVKISLEGTINYNTQRNRDIHKWSFEALDFLKEE